MSLYTYEPDGVNRLRTLARPRPEPQLEFGCRRRFVAALHAYPGLSVRSSGAATFRGPALRRREADAIRASHGSLPASDCALERRFAISHGTYRCTAGSLKPLRAAIMTAGKVDYMSLSALLHPLL